MLLKKGLALLYFRTRFFVCKFMDTDTDLDLDLMYLSVGNGNMGTRSEQISFDRDEPKTGDGSIVDNQFSHAYGLWIMAPILGVLFARRLCLDRRLGLRWEVGGAGALALR